jgi:hypothetical protein
MLQIKDGKGSGKLAEVDHENRLKTRSVTRSEIAHSVDEGKAWNVGTDFIELTDDSESALLYLTNTGAEELEVDLYIILTKPSTGGASEDGIVKIYRNPTAGTLLTSGTAITAVNMNFGTIGDPETTILKGAQGYTVTASEGVLRSKVGADNRLLLGVLTKLTRGAAVAVTYTPPTGNTSMEVEAVIELYEES